MKVKCTHKECGHKWTYNGKSDFFVTCPRCLGKVNIRKQVKEWEDE